MSIVSAFMAYHPMRGSLYNTSAEGFNLLTEIDNELTGTRRDVQPPS